MVEKTLTIGTCTQFSISQKEKRPMFQINHTNLSQSDLT